MKKTLTILFIILFCPQVSLVAKEDSYLHQVESCEKKNKKMGDLAWKQCLNKFQFNYIFGGFTNGQARFINENNKVKYFRVNISNDNYNFIITQIKDIKINISGFEEIIIDSGIINIWPQTYTTSFGCSAISPSTIMYVGPGCIFIDISSYGLSSDDVNNKNWSWSVGKTLGVKFIEEEKKLFNSKARVSDIDKCIKKHLKKNYNKDKVRDVCTFVLAEKLDSSKVKVDKNFFYGTDTEKEFNTLKGKIENNISNDFVIKKFSLMTKYNGDNCGGAFRLFEQVNIKPGDSYNIDEEVPEEGWTAKTIPCKKTKSFSTELDIWGFYY